MHSTLVRFALASAIIASALVPAQAQIYRSNDRTWHAFRGGLIAGYTSGIHTGDVPILPTAGNSMFADGSGGNFSFGLVAEKALTRFIVLGGSIVLDPMDAKITRTIQDPFRIADAQGNLYNVSREQSIEYMLRYITLKGYAKLYPSGGPGLFVGGSLGMAALVRNTYKNTQTIVEPLWAKGATGPAISGDIPNTNSIRYTVGALLGYEFFFNYGYIAPQLQYDLALNNVVDASWADTWSVNNLRALVTITFPVP